MKKIAIILMAMLALAGAGKAHAQYYSLINQTSGMLQTALTGGFRYRGLVDASYNRGLGDHRANLLEFTTTQGLKYADWFFMGLGAGVDVMFVPGDYAGPYPDNKGVTSTACMIPLFTEFRFNIGSADAIGLFISARLGAAFLTGNDAVQVGDGYIDQCESFYFKPSIGMRVPVSKSNSKQAFNIGLSYTLISNGGWYYNSYNSNDITLNSLGLSIGFEW